MNKWLAIGLLIFATIASWTIALSVDVDKYELGALVNIYYPPVFGILTILIFLILDWRIQKILTAPISHSKIQTIRITLTIILILTNIGFAFYIR